MQKIIYSVFKAHITEPALNSASVIPDEVFVEGMQQTYRAGVQFGIVILFLIALWFWIASRSIPKQKYRFIQQLHLAQLVGVCTVMATGCIAWDLWWHRAVGRDMFWEPPHVALYIFAFLAINGSMYGWYRTRESLWKRLTIALLIVPFSAPFDQFWHTIFGVEDLTRPAYLIWSLPHLAVAFSAICTQILLLPILTKDTNRESRSIMGMFIFGTLTSTGYYLLLPVHPTDGFGQLIGFWGVGLQAIVNVGGPLIARYWLQDTFGGTKIAFLTICMQLTAYGKETAENIIMLPHDRMPNWVIVFAILIGAVWIDVSDKVNTWLRGAIGGALSAFTMFWTARYFLEDAFWYGSTEVAIAVFSGAIGGMIAIKIGSLLIQKMRL